MTDTNPFAKGGAATKTKPAEEKAAPTGFDTAAPNGEVKAGASGDPFSLPSGGGSGAALKDFLGVLVLVKPTELLPNFKTRYGETDTIRHDTVFLTGDRQGELEEDMMVFQRPLVRALKKVLEGDNPYLLGRVARVKGKEGESDPYIFEVPGDEDVVLAQQYLAAHGKF